MLLKLVLAMVLLVVLVLANLPLILIGLVVWMVLAHQGVCRGPRRAAQAPLRAVHTPPGVAGSATRE